MSAFFTLLALLSAAALPVVDWAYWPAAWAAAGTFIVLAYATASKEKNHADQETEESPARPPEEA